MSRRTVCAVAHYCFRRKKVTFMILKGYLFSVLYALLCLLVAFVAYKLGAPKKITRKIVHILVGFEWVILYHFMGASIHFLVVCLLFLLILAVAHRKNLMPMISSDGDNAPGTVYYALAMSIMATITLFVPKMIVPFGIGAFCTSVGDGFAGVLGQSVKGKVNPVIYGKKTLVGAFANFAACFGVSLIFSECFSLGLGVLHCIAIAVFALELELFTGYGLDNIAITLGTSLLAFSFITFDGTANYILPILATPLIIAFSTSKKALTKGGIIAALILDVLISVSLGNFGFATLLAFFAGGVAIDKFKKKHNNSGQNIEKKGSQRDSVQVLSNGLIPACCAVLYFISNNKIFLIAFVASLAEALADTAASGIGSFAKRTFDPFRMKPCQKGISGGMSLLGTLSSLVGAALISVLALAFDKITIIDSLVVLAAGFLGGVFDSCLGSLLQVKYKCPVCQSIVEREEHCGEKTEKHSGIFFVNNDVVNLMGTLFAALVSSILCYIIY